MEKQRITYTPDNEVCSKLIIIDYEGNIIRKVQIVGGCMGNSIGLSSLLENMPVDEAIRRLEGIDCRQRGTSCPDQVAKALRRLSRS